MKSTAGKGPNTEGTYQVRALERGLSILEAFAESGETLPLSEIAKRQHLNTSTAHRLVKTLTRLGWLEFDEEQDKYRLGLKAFEVGSSYLHQSSVEQVARPFLETLAAESGQTASLGILDRSEVVYIGIVRGQQEVGIQSRVGARHPAYCTALGKVLLSRLDGASLRAVLDQGMPRRTENTITDPEILGQELLQVRRNGYAVDNEERMRGIYCIAAPILDHEDHCAAAVSISAPIFSVTTENRYRYPQLVMRTARRISEKLGSTLDDQETEDLDMLRQSGAEDHRYSIQAWPST